MPLFTEAFVSQFASMVFPQAEQNASRLRPYVTVESGVKGYRASFDPLGSIEAADVTTRLADTVYQNILHFRRWANLVDTSAAVLIDTFEKAKALINPQNDYRSRIIAALGRRIDRHIIAAAGGTAQEGSETPAGVVLPAAQKIAAGGTGFTLAKWRQGKKLLDDAEVEDDGRVLVIDSKALNMDLLSDTTLTSSDFNTVKALVDGQVDTFLGFKVVRTQLLEKNTGATEWKALMWQKAGVGLATASVDPAATIDRMPNKNNAIQVWAGMSAGAVRIEDKRVVEISYVV